MNRPLSHPLRAAEQTGVRARFTAAEFLRMGQAGAFDDMKVELIAGELARMNPPMSEHASGQAQIVIRLAAVVSPHLILGETGIVIDDDTVVACDAAVLRMPVVERRMLVADDFLLVVEVASTTLGRDIGVKRAAYGAAGIPHYWVVDTERRVIHVYGDPVAGDYAEVSTVRFGQPLAVPGSERTITLE